MAEKVVIATRRSRLALWQAEHVKAALQRAHPGLAVELLPLSTRGDELLDVSLAKEAAKACSSRSWRTRSRQGAPISRCIR